MDVRSTVLDRVALGLGRGRFIGRARRAETAGRVRHRVPGTPRDRRLTLRDDGRRGALRHRLAIRRRRGRRGDVSHLRGIRTVAARARERSAPAVRRRGDGVRLRGARASVRERPRRPRARGGDERAAPRLAHDDRAAGAGGY